jgi:hypothetical protein
MAKDFIEDPNYWHKRAEETRELAKRVSDNAARKRWPNSQPNLAAPHRIACGGPVKQDEGWPIGSYI